MTIIKFNQNLYTQESIQSAVEQFKGFGVRPATSRGRYYHVEMPDGDRVENLDILISEFKNHVLYLTITHAYD